MTLSNKPLASERLILSQLEVQFLRKYAHKESKDIWKLPDLAILSSITLTSELAKIRQTLTVEEYINYFEQLSDHSYNWFEVRIMETFVAGLWLEIEREVKARRPEPSELLFHLQGARRDSARKLAK